MFLKHIAHDVYVCGKTINLLKLCCPRVRRVPPLHTAACCPSPCPSCPFWSCWPSGAEAPTCHTPLLAPLRPGHLSLALGQLC